MKVGWSIALIYKGFAKYKSIDLSNIDIDRLTNFSWFVVDHNDCVWCFSNRNWKGLRYLAWWREVTSWRRGWGQHARRPNGPWLDSSLMASSPPPWGRSSESSWSQQWLQRCLRKNRGITQPKASLSYHMLFVRVPLSWRPSACCALCFTSPITDWLHALRLHSHFKPPHTRGFGSHQLLYEQTFVCVHTVLMIKCLSHKPTGCGGRWSERSFWRFLVLQKNFLKYLVKLGDNWILCWYHDLIYCMFIYYICVFSIGRKQKWLYNN